MTQRTLAASCWPCRWSSLSWLAVVLTGCRSSPTSPGRPSTCSATAAASRSSRSHGHQTYRDDGQLRMTTVSVTEPDRATSTSSRLMQAWVDATTTRSTRCDAVYPPDEPAAGRRAAGQRRDGHLPGRRGRGRADRAGLPASAGRSRSLAVTDGVAGRRQARGPRRDPARSTAAGSRRRPVSPTRSQPRRRRRSRSRSSSTRRRQDASTVTPGRRRTTSKPSIGVSIGTGYDFPFDVAVNIDDDIGGPSAGLMFSLGDLRHPHARAR